MTVIRVKHEKSYTCISNRAVRDRRLSFRARGIHHLLLSYPDDWRVSIDQISRQSDREGRDAVKAALVELEEYGYIKRQKIRDKKTGKLDWECVVRELPINGFSVDGDTPPNPHWEPDSGDPSINGFTIYGKPVDGENPQDLDEEIDPDDQSINGFTINGSTIYGKPVDGENLESLDVAGNSDDQSINGFTINGSTIYGSAIDGSTVGGKPVDILSTDLRSTDLRSTKEKEREKEPQRVNAPLSHSQNEIGTDPETEPQPSGPPQTDPDPENLPATPFNPGGDPNSAAAARDSKREKGFGSMLSAPERAEARFKTANPYPDMVAAGLECAWVGPKRTDFLPDLVEAAQRHLRQYDLPSEPRHAKNFIKNLIRKQDWAALELRLQEAEDYLARQQPPPAAPQSADPLPTLAEIEHNRASRLQALWDNGEHARVHRLIKNAPEWRLQVQDGQVVPLEAPGLC